MHTRQPGCLNLALIFAVAFLLRAGLLYSATFFPTYQPSQHVASKEIVLEVPANQAWTPSGVRLHPGDQLSIRYRSGLWSPWPGGAYDGIGFGGDPRCDCNVMQGVSHAALLGKIEAGQPFFVGNLYKQPVSAAGELYLGINDTRTGDNSSSIVVEISVER